MGINDKQEIAVEIKVKRPGESETLFDLVLSIETREAAPARRPRPQSRGSNRRRVDF